MPLLKSDGVLMEEIKVYDSRGRIVFVIEPMQSKYEIDLINYETGVYTIEVSSSLGIIRKKVILQ